MFQSFDPVSDIEFGKKHLPKLREVLTSHGFDGVLIPHDDEYQNEYLPDYAERLSWVSGFSGSAGFGIVLTKRAAVFSDGRYTIQLREQVDTDLFSLHQTPDEDPAKWLEQNTDEGARIAYDPMTFTESSLAPFLAAAKRNKLDLVPVPVNLVDEAWADQPAPPSKAIFPHAAEYTGQPASDKCDEIARSLKDDGIDAALITSPTSIAWLFNIRGGDVHASPLPLGRALLHADGTADLFVAPEKTSDSLRQHLGNTVSVRDEDEIETALEELGSKNKTITIDAASTPVGYVHLIKKSGGAIDRRQDPCALPRATKTDVELMGARNAHVRDGVAVTKFLHWLAHQTPSPDLTEINVAQKLESIRHDTGMLKEISFDTISGVGAHAAIAHYRVTTPTDVPLTDGSIFLIDSGGQYLDGTTDITRTMAIGTPTDEMRRHYTLVLKGHISLATARFPKGTSGHQLDALARKPLWDAGLDYDHGTGHGVGSYLGVHEGPQNISKKPIAQPLLPGMICSNEPGYYKAGEYGIRIENLIIVTQLSPIAGGDREMMAFETITLAPLERELIDVSLLTNDEREWLNTYHQRVFDELSDKLDDDVRGWLRSRTEAM